MKRPLKLPSNRPRARAENKALWNEARSIATADFFTIGYEGCPTPDLIARLKEADVQTLVDVRHTPISMYRPDLSKSNLKGIIEREGMSYHHSPEWGVPRDIRTRAVEAACRDPIWDWYEISIIERYFSKNLHWFLNLGHPVALMCMEADPTECHRHCLSVALEGHGFCGYDL